MNKKKIGLFSAVTMGIGAIIGSGLFGSFPSAAAICGTGLVIALVIAFLTTAVCLLIAYPVAYILARSKMKKKFVILLLFVIRFSPSSEKLW